MSAALLVLNPRHIPQCIEAIKALDIDTCWLTNMSEPQAAAAANEQITATNYARYLVLSDDTVPTQQALDAVLALADEGHPVVTGYCNLDESDHGDMVNLTTNALRPPPVPDSSYYHLMTRAQAEGYADVIPTTFAGLALTLMPRDLWLAHPLTPCPASGGQMDYMLSYRLGRAGIPIVAPVGAYVHHVKERWNFPDRNPEKRLLVGIEPPSVRWSTVEVAACPLSR